MSWKGSSWGGNSGSAWGASSGGKGGWDSGGANSWGSSKGGSTWDSGKSSKGKGSSWGQQSSTWGAGGNSNSNSSWGKGAKAAASTAPKVVAASGSPGAGASVSADKVKATLSKLTTDVTTQETMCSPSIESATKALEAESPTAASLKSTIDSLDRHQTKLNELKGTIMKETTEARKAGPAAAAAASDMSKLLIKCSSLLQKVTDKVNQMKPKHAKIRTEADFGRQNTLVTTALDAAQKALDNEKATPASLKASMDSLEKQQTKIEELKVAMAKEIEEARKPGGVLAAAQELQKVLVKYTQMAGQVNDKMNKLKFKHKRSENEAEMKVKEQKDAAAFKPVLAKATAEVTTAVNAVNQVSKQVDPLVQKPPDAGEELDKKIEAIQKAAEEAVQKAVAARTDLNERFKAIQAYAPETKKSATASLVELQKKLADRTSACQVYKVLKKEYPKLVANHKLVVELEEKLKGHDSNITKAQKRADMKITKEQVQGIDELVNPVLQAVKETQATITQKVHSVDAVTKEKMNKQKERGDELKKKVDDMFTKIKPQRDVFKAEEGIDAAKEKLAKLEKAWTACQDAEMPFLTGFEVLPDDINEAALKACNEATAEAVKLASDARTWTTNLQRDAKGYEKGLAEKTSAALTPIVSKITEIDAKVAGFRKETTERGVTAMVSNVLGDLEKKAKAMEAAGKALASTSLEDESVDSISEATQKAKDALEEAQKQSAASRKDLDVKRREAKIPQSSPALLKIQNALSSAQSRCSHVQNNITKAAKLVKAKEAIAKAEDAVTEAEANAEKAKKAVPKEGKKITMEKLTAIDEAVATASKSIQAIGTIVSPYLSSAPPKAKAEFQKLMERKTAAQEVLTQIKTDTKERREETLSEHYLQAAEEKTKAAEAADGKLSDAEAPFLVGAELGLKKTQEVLAKCGEVATEVSAAINAALKQSSQTMGKVNGFTEEHSKKVKEGLAAMKERINKVKTRLDTFNKDNSQRTKDSKVVEAQQKVDEVQANMKKLLAAAEPFEKEGADDMSEADAAAPLKAFMELDSATKKLVEAAKRHVTDCEREQKGNEEKTAELKKMLEAIIAAGKELAEKRKKTAPHEQKALGSRLLAECTEQVTALDAEIQKATAACAALLEKGGEDFLVGASLKTLVTALKAHMQEKELTEDALIKDATKGKKLKEKEFVKYLTDLPEAIGHDELSTLSDERKVAMFKRISASGSAVTQEDFKALFVQKQVCSKPTTVTNEFKVDGSETVCKVEKGQQVDVFGAPKEDEDAGLVRSECSVDGQKGWITLSQKKGAKYLQSATSPYRQFCSDADKAIGDARDAINKAGSTLNSKMSQGGKGAEGSRLKECRDEMAKLKEPIQKAQTAIKELDSKMGKARSEYNNKERAEQTAHIELKNAKEAAAYIDAVKPKIEALEAAIAAVEEAGASMMTLSGDELEAFATPASVREKVEKLDDEAKAKASEAREAVKEQTKAASEAKQSGGTSEAKKQLSAFSQKISALTSREGKVRSTIRSKCESLLKGKMESTAEGIRKFAQKKKQSPAQLFDSLKAGDKIPEKAFSKMLGQLEKPVAGEHAKLLFNKLEDDGISQATFLKYVVLYFKVVKTIAFTDVLDVTKAKTLSKAEIGLVVEVTEGPSVDAATQMTRIKGKATIDGKAVEGWVTVSGSKGTVFLEKTSKPVEKAVPTEP